MNGIPVSIIKHTRTQTSNETIFPLQNAFNDFCLHPVKNVYKSEEDRSALLGDIKRTYSCKKDLEYRMSTL